MNKQLVLAIGIAVVLLGWWAMRDDGDDRAAVSPSPSVVVSVSPSPSASPMISRTATPKPVGTPVAAMPQTYAEALKRYENARFQFDQYCQTRPANSSYKNGATVMLDNRSGDPRTVAVGGVQYNLAGYGWKIITLSSKTLPGTLYIDCGGAKNVAQVQMYK
jgi:hypothetical protein